MKVSAVLSFVGLAVAGDVFARGSSCHANKCARQVTGTNDGIPTVTSRQADCSSYQKVVYTPSPVTTTVTVQAEVLAARGKALGKRTRANKNSVPTWATDSCDTGKKFASACSCWGITTWTSTAPTPTVTVTTTADYCSDE